MDSGQLQAALVPGGIPVVVVVVVSRQTEVVQDQRVVQRMNLLISAE